MATRWSDDPPTWGVSILPPAENELDDLPDNAREECTQLIIDLAEDPFPAGHLKLSGARDLYRIRAYGERLRIVYQVNERRQWVFIWRVRPRATAYIGLEPMR
jgi:mRNA-degrading endonuclease RelE of RelBE toxin-antitoxin system